MPGPPLATAAEMSVTEGWPGAFDKAKVMLTPSLSKTTRSCLAADAAGREPLGPDNPAGMHSCSHNRAKVVLTLVLVKDHALMRQARSRWGLETPC